MRCGIATGAALVAVLACGGAAPLAGQALDERLPITATVLFNALAYDTPAGLESGALTTGRFAGRIGVPLSPALTVGFSVGSWQHADGFCITSDDCGWQAPAALTVNREAVLLQSYIQVPPRGGLPLFVRGGMGLGHTATFTPAGLHMVRRVNVYLSLAGGAGADLRLVRSLYLTPSIDYTVMPAVTEASNDLRGALAIGLGLTVK